MIEACTCASVLDLGFGQWECWVEVQVKQVGGYGLYR